LSTKDHILTASKQRVPILGTVNLLFQLGNARYPIKVAVLETMMSEMIIGTDFLAHPRNKVKIDVRNRIMTLRNRRYKLPRIPPTVSAAEAMSGTLSVPITENGKAEASGSDTYLEIDNPTVQTI
jgi:hypothetical protein